MGYHPPQPLPLSDYSRTLLLKRENTFHRVPLQAGYTRALLLSLSMKPEWNAFEMRYYNFH